ncbi:spermidine/putrescine ABC transporter substrate-binding protein [Streptomyces tanashiensis]
MRRSLRDGRAAMTRRSLLRASAGGALTLGGLGALSACGIPAAGKTEGGTSAEDHSAEEKTVSFSNWTEYMDVDDSGKHHPTLEAFARRTGIKVKYTEDINDNNEFFGKIKPQLAAGQDTGRDLICVTDWLAARIIRLGWAQKLDPANLPNAYANLSAQFRRPDWDPGAGPTRIPWHGHLDRHRLQRQGDSAASKVDVGHPSILDDPALKGRVGFLTEMRDSVGMTLLDMGERPGQLHRRRLRRGDRPPPEGRRQAGRSAASPATTTPPTCTSGDIAACLAWAGDVVQLQADSPDVDYVHPRPPATSPPATTCSIPAQGPAQGERRAAHRLLLRASPPAAQLAAYINYVCPVDGVKDELAKIDPELANNTLILPDKAMAKKSHAFRSLSSAEETAYEEKFAKLIGA